MNPIQKLLWGLVLLAATATAAAGVRALSASRSALPTLGDLGPVRPARLAGHVWIAQVLEGECDDCRFLHKVGGELGHRLATEPGLTVETIAWYDPPPKQAVAYAGALQGEEGSDLVDRLHALAGAPSSDPKTGEIVLRNSGDLGSWKLTGEDGRPFGSEDLAARIWIADFIFTSCAGPCPLMCDAMQKLVKRLPDTPRLKFVSFSVDPRRDTPDVLKEFSRQWDAPLERWRFVTGTGVYNLAYDGFKLEARPSPMPEPGAEFIHSTRFTLVDGRGRMRGIYKYDYDDPDSMGPLLDAIERDARALLETPERVVDHAHDKRFFLVDRRGNVRGAYPSGDLDAVVRDARSLARSPEAFFSLRTLPRINAALNGASFCLLSLGLAFILKKKVGLHKACMTAALVTSTLFLVSYLAYHFQAGSVKYAGQGFMRTAYFAILLSHTVLAALVAPLAIVTVVRAWKEKFDRHVAIARWTLPVWMYVSLTGILVYLMLYQIP